MGFRFPVTTTLKLLSATFVLIGTTVLTTVLSTWLWISPAAALASAEITDIGYQDCPEEMAKGSVTSGGGIVRMANCYLISGTVTNKTGKPIVNADVFGRIYDSTGNAVLENRTRLGSIDEIPPGESEFSIRVTVPDTQAGELQLKQFKASGFTGKVRR
ncbi:MAG: FxLYD domain-containing protein [Cyanobacteria bacterium P01_D01_bin.73]